MDTDLLEANSVKCWNNAESAEKLFEKLDQERNQIYKKLDEKGLLKELLKERLEVAAEIKPVEECVKALENDRSVLRKQLREVNMKMDEAQKCTLNLRNQQNDVVQLSD